MFMETARQFDSAYRGEAMPSNSLQARLAAARRAFTTRNVDFADVYALDGKAAPCAGDLVFAKVVAIGLSPARGNQHRYQFRMTDVM